MIPEDSGPSCELPPSAEVINKPRRPSIRRVISRYFWMSEEVKRAQVGHFQQTDPGFGQYLSAKRCLEVGQSFGQDVWLKLEGLAILRTALHFALVAWQSRQQLRVENSLPELWRAFANHPCGKRLVAPLTCRQLELVEYFVGARDMLYVASLTKQDCALLGKSLLVLTSEIVKELALEALSVQRLKALRAFRLVFIPLAIVAVVSLGYLWFTRPVNYALNKPVELSSSFLPQVYRAQALVNGDTVNLGIHTMPAESQWAQIDLEAVRKIRRVVVYNRRDLPGNSIPLQIDTSLDGKTFRRFANHDTEFLDWTAKGRPIRARYVRLTVKRLSSLQLNEVEVY
jgi:hypothetical protein